MNVRFNGGFNFFSKTLDGGFSWIDLFSSTNNLKAFALADLQNIWVVGWKGEIWHSSDGGQNWNQQESGTTENLEDVFFLDRNTGWAVGGRGTILKYTSQANNPPIVTITNPPNNSSFTQGETINFTGTATDTEEGPLPGSSMFWTSSRDGQIGTGTSISVSNLSIGTHTITLSAKDSQGAEGNDQITIIITEQPKITVVKPNGGETWQAGQSHEIQWTSSGDVGSQVKIELHRNTVFEKTITASTANDGAFIWTIAANQAAASDYHIKVTALSNQTVSDFSDNFFAIVYNI
ncbi:MAG: YCF48-related protein [bacterium]